MNVRPEQLSAVVGKKLYPVYLVSGDEPLQQMECLDLLRDYLRQQDYLEREVLDVDAQFDWSRLQEETANMSLFASRRIIELRLPTAKPGKLGSQAIKQYLQNPADDIVVIINAGKIDGNAKKSTWFKAIDQSGMVVQCWPVPLDKLSGWLKQRFLKREMDADDEVLAYVSQHVEGNLLAAVQEIEKLYLLLGPGKISYADVADAITSQSRFSVFELADVLLKGNSRRVIRILAGLKAEGIVPVLVNWALTKEIRLLTQVSADASSVDYQLRRTGLWQSRIELFKVCLSRHHQRSFQVMLKRCAYIDAASKGVFDVNVWDEIEILCVRLAGSTRRQ